MLSPGGQLPEAVGAWIASSLFEHAPLSIAVIDPTLRVVGANSNFVAIFGEASGRPCHQVYKKRDEPCPGCAVQRTLRDGKSRVSEEQGVDCIGQQAAYVVHHAAVTAPDGRVSHVVNMSTDVTERRQFQHQVNLIFEHAPCALTVINKDFLITRANDQVRQRFGEPTGARCYELYKGRESRCAECPAQLTFADGQRHTSEQVRPASDGSASHHLVSTTPLPFGNGEISHVIEMSLDVTETHRLTQKLLESERLAAVGQTVTQLAHSIKNILTGLQGGIYDIRVGQERRDGARAAEGLQMLTRNYQRIAELVQNFLRFSREHRPEVQPVDPVALAREVHDLYREVAQKHGVRLELEAEPVAPAWLDPRGLHTCLTNLVANAFDACKQSEGPCSISLRVLERDAAVIFEVQDSGCGMDDVVQGKIFGGSFTTKGPSGSGLGLPMTRKIVVDHGGSINVRSAPGAGALFRIELPRARLPRPADGERVADTHQDRRERHGQ